MQKKCYFGCKVQGSLHTFPFPHYPHEDRFNQWKSVLKEDVINKGNKYIKRNLRLCGRHFEPCYQTRGDRITANSVPTINLTFVTEPDPAPIPPTKSGGHVPMPHTCNVSTLLSMPPMDNIDSTSNICTNGEKVNQIHNINKHNKVEIKYFGAVIEADKETSEYLRGLGDTDESSRYVVKNILAKRFNPRCKRYEFLLEWKRHPINEFTWVAEEDMGKCKQLIKKFEQVMKPNKPKQLKITSQISAPPTVNTVDMKAETVTDNKPISEVGAIMRESVGDSEPAPKVKMLYDDNNDFHLEHDDDVSTKKGVDVQVSPKKDPNPNLDNCLSGNVLPETKTDSELAPYHNTPNVNITDVLQEMGLLNVLVCGRCHTVFHFIMDFIDHKEANNCSKIPPLTDTSENVTEAWGYILWKYSSGAQSLGIGHGAVEQWYMAWCRMPEEHRALWVAAGNRLRVLSQFMKQNITQSDVMAQNVLVQQALNQLDTSQPNVTQKGNTNVITDAVPQEIEQTKQISKPVSKIHIPTVDQINTHQRDKQAVEKNSTKTRTHRVVKQTDKTERLTRQRLPKLIKRKITKRSTKKEMLSSVVKKYGKAITAKRRLFTLVPHLEQRTRFMFKTSNHNKIKNSEDCTTNRSQSSEDRVGLGKRTGTLSGSKEPRLMFRGADGMLYRVEGENEAGETLLQTVDDDLINFIRQESQDPLSVASTGGVRGRGGRYTGILAYYERLRSAAAGTPAAFRRQETP